MNQWHRFHGGSVIIPGHLLNLATRMALDAFNVALAKGLHLMFVGRHLGHTAFLLTSVDHWGQRYQSFAGFTCQPERHDELLTLANEVMVKRLAKGISEQERTNTSKTFSAASISNSVAFNN